MKRRVSTLLPMMICIAAAAAADQTLTTTRLPLRFERNDGQADARVRFVARERDGAVYLTDDALVLARPGVRIGFAGANRAVRVAGVGDAVGRTNYFGGNDAKRWHTGIPAYPRVRYENLYPNVDLIVYARGRDLEYDFVVGAQARPDVIRLTVDGGRASIDDRGDLRVTTPSDVVSLSRPRVYQDRNGGRQEIAGRYRVLENGEIGFTVEAYDHAIPLVIDPVLAYSTYLGGNDWDVVNNLKADAAGNAYVCGYTASLNFPVNTGRADSGGYDAFIAKLRNDGSLEYATYLGGGGFDTCTSLAVGPSGAVYAAGGTTSSDFPTAGALQPAPGGGTGGDAFITKIDPTGSVLLYSTYLGGSGAEDIVAIALDASGAMYVTGVTNSPDFPLVAPVQSRYGGGFLDAFAAKINPAGSAIVFSTLMGGSDSDEPIALAVTAAGEMVVGGVTLSTDFPVVTPIQARHGGSLFDGFLFKLAADGSAVRFATYLGTSGWDAVVGLKALDDGSVLVSGYAGFGFQTTAGAFQRNFAGYTYDAFVSHLSADGQQFLFSTYFGGNRDESATRIDTDAAGNIWIVGASDSTNLPMVNPVQGTFGGGVGSQDAFVAELSANGSQLLFSTYLGGSDIDSGLGLGIDASGNVYVAGQTASTDFPTVRPIQASGGGPRDAFVACIAVTSPAIAALTATPSVLAPPNHQMIEVALVATLTPACRATRCEIVSVSSNEGSNATGDGNTASDWTITGPMTLRLRAERSASGAGRVYTIVVRCIDSDGDITTRNVTVTVPSECDGQSDDQKRKYRCASGSTSAGSHVSSSPSARTS